MCRSLPTVNDSISILLVSAALTLAPISCRASGRVCASIVQLEAIKNVDKIISNSIYILKDNLPFTGTNNIINSIEPVARAPSVPSFSFIEVAATFGICPAAWLSLFVSLLPSSSRFAGAFTICQQLKFSKHFWICLPGYTLAALSVSGSRVRGAGTLVSWLSPAGTFCICLQHSSIALAALVVAVAVVAVASRPRCGCCVCPWSTAWHPLFWFLSTAWICKLPGLAWPGCNKASHFTTSSNCVGRIRAAALRSLKTFLVKCFSFSASRRANQTCLTPLSSLALKIRFSACWHWHYAA